MNAAWHEKRRAGIGGSDATKIMAGGWKQLWAVKTGRLEDENLDHVLPVQIGKATEALNALWFARETGFAIGHTECEHITHPQFAFMRANLDGRVLPDSIFEAKHVSDRYKLDEIVSRYFWQLQHYMCVVSAAGCYLSTFFGNSRWEYAQVARDDNAINDLMKAETAFWGYVERDEEPADHQPPGKVEIDLSTLRVVDMSHSNSWTVAAGVWLETKKPAKRFEAAAKDLKELVEADVGRAHGAGVQIKRARNGALTITEAA